MRKSEKGETLLRKLIAALVVAIGVGVIASASPAFADAASQRVRLIPGGYSVAQVTPDATRETVVTTRQTSTKMVAGDCVVRVRLVTDSQGNSYWVQTIEGC